MYEETISRMVEKLEQQAGESGYHLNPDREFTRELVEGLVTNTERYGYPSCPCRLATGVREEDRDIICPCDYRDPDLTEYGCCYCSLYVSEDVVKGEARTGSIPERRPAAGELTEAESPPSGEVPGNLTHPVWRCSVCGYLCAREEPPEKCPICKVDRERFRRFM
jgi:ferredoxin-thioredoxin reductase catalytic subunit